MPARQPLHARLCIMAVVFCVMASGSLAAENPGRGAVLYDNQCRFCHESQVHIREDRRVTGLVELHKRVTAWSAHAGLGWNDEEVDDVVAYLNQSFYHFPQ
jgi:mono/diheme cytochrome c family protein